MATEIRKGKRFSLSQWGQEHSKLRDGLIVGGTTLAGLATMATIDGLTTHFGLFNYMIHGFPIKTDPFDDAMGHIGPGIIYGSAALGGAGLGLAIVDR